jgi:hypothetical protein
MSLLDTYNLIYAPPADLISRITAATYQAALDIRNESPQTANHAHRLDWANATLGGLDALARAGTQAAWHVFGNATIRADPANADDNALIYSVVTDALPRLIAPE